MSRSDAIGRDDYGPLLARHHAIAEMQPGTGREEERPRAARMEFLVRPKAERRRSVADELMRRMIVEHQSFWKAVYPLYAQRELTRTQLRELVHKGLQQSRGNYRIVTKMFNMDLRDYRKFLNFLRKHECLLPFRQYR